MFFVGFLVLTVSPALYFWWSTLSSLLIQPDVPRLTYSVAKTPYNYTPGLEVEGVIWQEPYREYDVMIRNPHITETVVDLRLRFEFPWPVITSRVTLQTGAQDVVMTRDDEPIKVGTDQRITKVVGTRTNVLLINVGTLSPKGDIHGRAVLTTGASQAERGLLHVAYRHRAANGRETKKNYLHQITVIDPKTSGLRIEPTTLKGKQKGVILIAPKEPVELKIKKPGNSPEANR